MKSLFPEPENTPPQAARLAPKLRALAEQGVYFGTSRSYVGLARTEPRPPEDRFATLRETP